MFKISESKRFNNRTFSGYINNNLPNDLLRSNVYQIYYILYYTEFDIISLGLLEVKKENKY